jgi:undecaprenyl phosphate N,N'-diacetylbacillosamine 1-phosphate transferase
MCPYFKCLFDSISTFLWLLILLPFMAVVTILLYFSNSGQPFFKQKRPGMGGCIFSIVKFKNMNDNRDGSGNLLSCKDPLKATGKFIRSTSMDEVPQLINMLNGNMSLVGPRSF